MPSRPPGGLEGRRDSPSMLDLVRLSGRPVYPPGGQDLYRQIALLTGMRQGLEILDVPCGPAVPLEYFAREHGIVGYGADPDPDVVTATQDRLRGTEAASTIHLQHAPTDDLPYRDETFDVVVGELGLAAGIDPGHAVRELVRVVKPGGQVVMVQLVWTAPVDAERAAVLSEHLGTTPRMLVEWKQLLRGAGVRDLHIEDWSDPETAFRPHAKKPFPDFAELFSVWEKLGILRRAWGRWGWRGVATALAREGEVHRLLTRERILSLVLVKGVRGEEGAQAGGTLDWERAETSEAAETSRTRAGSVGGEGEGVEGETGEDVEELEPSVRGLPLFRGEDEG